VRTVLAGYRQEEKIRQRHCAECKAQRVCRLLLQDIPSHLRTRNAKGIPQAPFIQARDYPFLLNHVCQQQVEHLHYTAWPDHGVPLYTHPVVTYLKKLLATPPGNGSVVVHCSAGVGRTGTIILCDICLRRAAAEGVITRFA